MVRNSYTSILLADKNGTVVQLMTGDSENLSQLALRMKVRITCLRKFAIYIWATA